MIESSSPSSSTQVLESPTVSIVSPSGILLEYISSDRSVVAIIVHHLRYSFISFPCRLDSDSPTSPSFFDVAPSTSKLHGFLPVLIIASLPQAASESSDAATSYALYGGLSRSA